MLQHSSFSPAQLESSAVSVDEKNFRKLQAAYNACLDEETIRKIGVVPLVMALNETTRKFYHNTDDKKALSETVLHLSKLGVTALLAIDTGADDKDPDTVVVSVSAPYSIGLPAKELYGDEKVLKRYEEVASQVLSALYPNSNTMSSNYHALIEFEKKLAAASPDAEDRDDVTVGYGLIRLIID